MFSEMSSYDTRSRLSNIIKMAFISNIEVEGFDIVHWHILDQIYSVFSSKVII
jgi:hypothetical protein